MKSVCVLVLEEVSIPTQIEKLADHFLSLDHNPTGQHQPRPGVCLLVAGSTARGPELRCHYSSILHCPQGSGQLSSNGAAGNALLLGYLVLRSFDSAVQLEYGCMSGCFAGKVHYSGRCRQQ